MVSYLQFVMLRCGKYLQGLHFLPQRQIKNRQVNCLFDIWPGGLALEPTLRTCCSNFLYLMEFAITAWTLCFHFVTLCRSVVIASVFCQEKARESEVVSDMSRLELSLGISRNERSNIHAVLAKINKCLKLGEQVRSVGSKYVDWVIRMKKIYRCRY